VDVIYYNSNDFYDTLENTFECSDHSIYLAGPTPRDKYTKSWRPDALYILWGNKYDGVVIVPEMNESFRYSEDRIPDNIYDWENYYMTQCNVIAFWVPRELKTMPAFTTNIEFGRFCGHSRSLYGRPDGAPKTAYLDWLYMKLRNKKPHSNLSNLMIASMNHFRL